MHRTARRRSVLLTGALLGALVLPAAAPAQAASFPDQGLEGTVDGAFPVSSVAASAQTFTPSFLGGLEKVSLHLGQNAGHSSTADLTVAIRPVKADGSPASVVLASTTITAADLSSADGETEWIDVTFDSPAVLKPETTYALVLSSDADPFEPFVWLYTDNSEYTRGQAYRINTSDSAPTWQDSSTQDLHFGTYLDPGNDDDGDGWTTIEDCDDTNTWVNPGADEVWNKIDDDCDGIADDGLSTAGKPTVGTATSGARGGAVTAKARWSAPQRDGNLPINSYKVQAQRLNAAGNIVDRSTTETGPDERAVNVTLPAGRYSFRVAAVNDAGRGAWSKASNAVTAR